MPLQVNVQETPRTIVGIKIKRVSNLNFEPPFGLTVISEIQYSNGEREEEGDGFYDAYDENGQLVVNDGSTVYAAWQQTEDLYNFVAARHGINTGTYDPTGDPQ